MTTTIASSYPPRDAMIIGQLGQVRLIAQKMQRRLPSSITLDDLISAGTIGLIQAVDRFDPSRGCQLNTFVEHRIRGAMLDLLRKEDPLGRAERKQAKSTPCPLRSLDQLRRESPALLPPAPGLSPWDQAAQNEWSEKLAQARARLPFQAQEVLRLLDQGLTNRAAAQELGIHESTFYQIKADAVRRLRALLGIGSRVRAA